MDSNDIPPLTPPPSYNPPPPIMMSQTPPRPRKSRGWMIVALVLLALLVFSLFGNFAQMLGNVMPVKVSHMRTGTGPQFDEMLVEDNDSENKIAVVEVSGVIMSGTDQGGFTMVEKIKEQLKHAQEDEK